MDTTTGSSQSHLPRFLRDFFSIPHFKQTHFNNADFLDTLGPSPCSNTLSKWLSLNPSRFFHRILIWLCLYHSTPLTTSRLSLQCWLRYGFGILENPALQLLLSHACPCYHLCPPWLWTHRSTCSSLCLCSQKSTQLETAAGVWTWSSYELCTAAMKIWKAAGNTFISEHESLFFSRKLPT